ncbi:hypothetical protein MSAN_01639500 [Mycena sanguinolenta]|uniref:Uncharacterized protein n=1 Tax=Mycena sanguinolenta TaxID=230812 RepID=A0A8H6Y025_9AGAR|nr:hypothetical protein MSAN_01639500 [Mycena sanguinolenta]
MNAAWTRISILWVGTFFYGIHLVLFCICLYILIKRPRNLGNIIFLLNAIALFATGTIQIGFNTVLTAAEFGAINIPSKLFNQIVDGISLMYVINNFMSDALVIYRCYVIWGNNILVTILPILMLIASTVLGFLGLSTTLGLRLSSEFFLVLSLATNVLVTALTAGRISWVSRRSRAYLETAAKRRYASAVAILIETGMLYSVNLLAVVVIYPFPSLFFCLGGTPPDAIPDYGHFADAHNRSSWT